MPRKKPEATDPLTDQERAYCGYVHEGRSGTEAVKLAFGDEYKRPSQKSTKLKRDPRVLSLLSALKNADHEQCRRIAHEEGVDAEERFRKICRAFRNAPDTGKSIQGLVKLAHEIDVKEGRTKEKGGSGDDSAILRFLDALPVNRQSPALEPPEDPNRLPGVLGRVHQDTDEEARTPAAYLQPGPARPDSTSTN